MKCFVIYLMLIVLYFMNQVIFSLILRYQLLPDLKKIFVFGSTWIYSLHNPYRLDI